MKRWMLGVAVAGAMALAVIFMMGPGGPAAGAAEKGTQEEMPAENLAKATFAGGCFWCMEGPFEKLDGVAAVVSGYSGGHVDNPTYEEVSAGRTGHAESVQISYDPEKISYRKLLEVFWHNIDPTDGGGQFCDRGNQYRSAIFYHDEEQKRLAQLSKSALEESGRLGQPIVTEIVPLEAFYAAEEYHQDFYKKQPRHYNRYRFGCGRDRRLKKLWGDDAGH